MYKFTYLFDYFTICLLYYIPLTFLFIFLKIRNNYFLLNFFLFQVNITLDQKCKHPNLCISNDNRRVKSSNKTETALKAMVVATEGFSDKEHYWEVEVGNQSEWELGVVSEKIRDMIMNNTENSLPVNNLVSLQYSQGKYILTGGEDVSDCKQCSVVGVLLDLKNAELSFYNVEEMSPLGFVYFEFTGRQYPFFSPDSSGEWLGVRSVKPQTYDSLT